MIRFIDLGAQIYDNESQFCFFDTIGDKFISFGDTQVFSNLDDFTDWTTGYEDKELVERCQRLAVEAKIVGTIR